MEESFTQNISFLTVLAPPDAMEFPANMTLCRDPAYANEFFLAAPESEVDWTTIWFSSGIVASLCVKVIAANFAFSLALRADPLGVSCNGQYEGSPHKIRRCKRCRNFRHQSHQDRADSVKGDSGCHLLGNFVRIGRHQPVLFAFQWYHRNGVQMETPDIVMGSVEIVLAVAFAGFGIMRSNEQRQHQKSGTQTTPKNK